MKFDFDTRPSDSPLVEAVWGIETEGKGESFISTAESRWEMVITKQMGKFTLSIRGPETKATPTPIPEGHAEYLGIIFKRGVFMPHFPKQKLVNDAIHLPQSTRNAFTVVGGVDVTPLPTGSIPGVADLYAIDIEHNIMIARAADDLPGG